MVEHVVRDVAHECGCGNRMDYASKASSGPVTSGNCGKAKKHRRGKKKGGCRHQWRTLTQLEEQSSLAGVHDPWSPPRRHSPKPSDSDSEADRMNIQCLIKAAERLDRRNKHRQRRRRVRPTEPIPAPANSNQFLMADNENCQQFDEQFERLYGSSSEECEWEFVKLRSHDDEGYADYLYDYSDHSHYFTDYDNIQNGTLADELALKSRSELIEQINNLNDVLSQSEHLQSDVPESLLQEYYKLKAENDQLLEEHRLLQIDN